MTCCHTVHVSLSPSSPAYRVLKPYLGLYRRVAGSGGDDDVNGAPHYRLQGNYNVWLARTLPLSSFSLAAWAVGHDLGGGPGQIGGPTAASEPLFFLAGNSKCPRFLAGAFYREKRDGAYLTEKELRVTCYQ